MIQYIALALALDAESKSGQANDKSNLALNNSKKNDSFVIVRPVDKVKVPVKEAKGFWARLGTGVKTVLDKKPWGEFSIRKSDIQSLEQYQDDDGSPYVFVKISTYANVTNNQGENLIGLRIPGKLEDVTAVLNGA